MGLKLLYITNGINGSGGLERVLSIKASYFTEKLGYEVTILSLNDAHLDPFYQFSEKIRMVSIPVGGNPIQYIQAYKKGIQKTVNKIQPDIISVCDDGLKGFFLPTVIKTKAKWIYERHASIELNKQKGFSGKIQANIMKLLSKSFDAFVVLTPTNMNEWKGNNICAIANPLSFISDKINLLDQKNIIAVGSHSYNKGYDTLLKIWKTIEINHPDWQLEIYGKFDKEQTFINLSKELELSNVVFHPPVANIQEKFEESSIMVLPSRSEGFGMVLIEAMVCGVPCIAFDCPSGPRDIIQNEIDGFLIENQNQKEFESAIINLIENADLRVQMGTTAQQNVKHYAMEQIAQDWTQLFKAVLK